MGRGAEQHGLSCGLLTGPFYPVQLYICFTHSWRRSGALPAMPWLCMIVLPGQWSHPSSTICLTSTSSGLLRSMASPTLGASTRRPLRYLYGVGVHADRRIPESLPVERMAEGFPEARCWDSFPSPLLSLTPWCQVLSDEHAREMCLRFADMECKLGEIDRARAIYSFCSQICDPRVGLCLVSRR